MEDSYTSNRLENTRGNMLAFFHAVLPETGTFYYTYRVSAKILSERYPVTSHEELLDAILQFSNTTCTWFSTAGFKDGSSSGALNVASLKAFRIDVDTGAIGHKDPGEYATPEEAVGKVLAFCADMKIPAPRFVFTAHGVHAWWPLKTATSPELWKLYAEGLKGATKEWGLYTDEGITASPAHILRSPGSFNWKEGFPVEVQMDGNFFASDDINLTSLDPILAFAPKRQSKKAPGVSTAGGYFEGSEARDEKTVKYWTRLVMSIPNGPNDKVSHLQRYTILGAIYELWGNCELGENLARAWCKKSPKYTGQSQFPQMWEGFEGYRESNAEHLAGPGTLVHLAKEAGWSPMRGEKPIDMSWAEIDEVTPETAGPCDAPKSEVSFTDVKTAILAGEKADALKIWASFLGHFMPTATERTELVHLISNRMGAGVNDIKKDMLSIEQERVRQHNDEAFKAKTAGSTTLYEPFSLPDEEAGPVMIRWDEICCNVKSIEPPMRDANNWPCYVNRTEIPGMHVLTSMTANGGEDSTLPAPKNFLLKSHDRFSLELELGDYVTFYTVDMFGRRREVAPSGRFIDHFLHYERSRVPRVYTVLTMPVVLADRTILNRNGLDRDRHLILRIDSEMEKYIPALADCTPETVANAYRFLRDDWLCDVLADAEGKAIIIAFALSIIERCLFPARPAFFISAGLRGGGKTTAFNMVSMAVLGELTAASAWSTSGEERRKSLLANLMTGVACITWDNVSSGSEVHCAHLERALTSEIYADRKLGETETLLAQAYSIMSFTGNNIRPHDDLASRSLVINLATDRPDPENREFRRADPVGWTRVNRGKILLALYTVLLGNPIRDNIPATRFKNWMALVGTAVEYAAELTDERPFAERGTPAVSFKSSFEKTEANDSANSEKADILTTLNDLFDKSSFTALEVLKHLVKSEKDAEVRKEAEDPEMLELRHFCTAQRATHPTKKSVNAALKGIVNGPTMTYWGVVTLKEHIDSHTRKSEFRITVQHPEMDETDTAETILTREMLWEPPIDGAYGPSSYAQ